MDINEVRAWFTLVMFLTFVGILVWAYSRKRKQGFSEAERLALDDPDYPRSRIEAQLKTQEDK